MFCRCCLFFNPFNSVQPEIFGEILWRAFGFGLFALGLWQLAAFDRTHWRGVPTESPFSSLGRDDPPGRSLCFLSLVALATPASLASLNNGQTNLPLSACLVFSVLMVRSQKWNLAALFLTLSIILKPIALAPFLLAFAVFPTMRKPLLISFIAFIGLGFCHPELHYAADRWVKCLQKILISYTPENLRVSDLFGALGKWGLIPNPIYEKLTRGLACLGALGWVWQAFCRKGLPGASWALWVASALVFTVFNPRVETNSYVLISPLLAYAAVSYWREVEGGKWKGIVLAGTCIGLMCDGMGLFIYKATDVWFKPTIVLLVSPLLIRMPDSWKKNA
ncbi:MAG: DUF2029 domain-containing protein [Candidatus Omnitrophica bacterium]|nr:DUF2029 domain-containing protein [Candidatus Omnitrophota bacterium]